MTMKKKKSREVTRWRTAEIKKNGKYFHCPFPGCVFRTVGHSSMRRHRLLHNSSVEKRKPFACSSPGCFYRASHRWNLIEHEQTHDPNHYKRFSCPNCSRHFTRKRDVARHQVACKGNGSTVSSKTTKNEEIVESETEEEDDEEEEEKKKKRTEIGEMLSIPEKIQIVEEKSAPETIQMDQDSLQPPEEIQIGDENLVLPEKIQTEDENFEPQEKIQIQEEELQPLKTFESNEENLVPPHKIESDYEQLLSPPKIQMDEKSSLPPQKIQTGDLLLPQKVKRFKCPKCGHRTGKLFNAKRHLKKHLKSPYKCHVPGCTSIGGFDTVEDLMKHLSDLHVLTVAKKELLPIIGKTENIENGMTTRSSAVVTEKSESTTDTNDNNVTTRVLRSSARKIHGDNDRVVTI